MPTCVKLQEALSVPFSEHPVHHGMVRSSLCSGELESRRALSDGAWKRRVELTVVAVKVGIRVVAFSVREKVGVRKVVDITYVVVFSLAEVTEPVSGCKRL